MRTQLFSSILFVSLVGCGGGGGDAKPDAKIFLDAPVDAPAVCTVKCELKPPVTGEMGPDLCEGDNYKAISYGAGAAGPVDGDYFFTFGADAGPLANRTAFSIGLIVSESSTLADVLFIRALKPEVGGFPLATAIPMDPNPAAPTPAAYSFLFGDVMVLNGQIQPETITQDFWATTGAITFTQIAEADGSLIDGQTAPIEWSEIDETGAVIPGGCKINMGPLSGTSGFGFKLTQMEPPPALQAQQPQYINGMRVLSPQEMAKLNAYVDKHYPHLVQ